MGLGNQNKWLRTERWLLEEIRVVSSKGRKMGAGQAMVMSSQQEAILRVAGGRGSLETLPNMGVDCKGRGVYD